MTIATLLVNIAAETVQLQKQAAQINKQLEGISSAAGTVAGALGIAFSVGAIAAFVGQIMNTADELERMKDQTGIGVESLQRLRAAAENSGNTLDQVVKAISKLQVNLGSGNKGAVGAINELGFSVDQLLAMDPEQQFTTIAGAIGAIEDPSKRAAAAVAIFGKSGAELLPTFRADIEELTKGVHVMSAETTAALDQFGDAWGNVGRNVKAVAGNTLAFMIKWTGDYITGVWDPQAAAIQQVIDKQNEFKNSLPKAPKGPTGLTGAPLGMPAVPSKTAQMDLENLAKKHLENAVAADKHAAAVKKADAEYRALGNWIEERRFEQIAAQQKKVKDETEMYTRMLAGMHTKLLLVATDAPQMFMKLADGTQQVLEKNHTWRETLAAVADSMSVVGDRWASVAVGMIRNLEGVIQLWQQGFKAQAIGQAIGALGQLIPASDKAAVSAARFASQGAAVGSVFGPWGTAIGAAAGAVYGWIKAGQDAKKANDLRDAFQKSFGSLEKMDAALHRVGMTAKEVFDARSVKQFEAAVAEFNRRLKLQADTWAEVNALVEKYGFNIEELGPAMQRQQLDEQAAGLYHDWMLLAGAGIDLDVIAQRMAKSINDYIHLALKLGLEVPAAMKPMIQKLIDMGLLTDANGNLIENLEDSGITFAETMTESFKKVTDALHEMIDLLRSFLGLSSQVAPPAAPNIPPKPDPAEGYATGTMGRFVNFSSGRNVRLHGWERISTPREDRGAGGTVVVNIHGGSFDTPLGRQRTVEQISRAVMDAQRRTQRMAS